MIGAGDAFWFDFFYPRAGDPKDAPLKSPAYLRQNLTLLPTHDLLFCGNEPHKVANTAVAQIHDTQNTQINRTTNPPRFRSAV